MIARLVFCVVVLCGAAASAADIVVRSGEHGDFTRLVVEYPKGTEWQIERDEATLRLRTPRDAFHYDVSQVFSLIPRTRVRGLSQDDGLGDLLIDLDPNMVESAFALETGAVVLDIFEATARVEPSGNISGDPPAPLSRSVDFPPVNWPGLTVPPSASDGQTPLPNLVLPDQRIAQTEEALRAQLSRAAAQGLIRIDTAPIEEKGIRGHDRIGPQLPIFVPSLEEPPEALAVSSQTAVDRERRTMPSPVVVGPGYNACPSDAAFDVAGWFADGNATALIGHARRAMLEEFDAPKPDKILEMARNQVALGFGLEARLLLMSYEMETKDIWPILMIASVIDDFPIKGAGAYSSLVSCDRNVALWALLASEQGDPAQVNFEAVQRAFSALPAHLRRQIGPQLVEMLIDLGATDIAGVIRNAVARTAVDYAAPLSVIDARLAGDAPTPGMIAADLASTISEDGAHSVDALLLAIDSQIRAGMPVHETLVGNAGALAAELSGTPQGFALLRAHALGLGSSGQFDSAFEVLSDWSPEESPTMRSETAEWLFRGILAIPYDLLFTREFYRHRTSMPASDTSDPLRLEIADRLLQLGLPDAAQQIIREETYATDPARLMLAKVALAHGDGASALSHLTGVKGPDVPELAARAYEMLGLHEDAKRHYLQGDEPSRAQSAAWLEGDWDSVQRLGTEPQRHFVDAFGLSVPHQAQPDAAGSEQPEPLKRSRELLAQSAAERAALDRILVALEEP